MKHIAVFFISLLMALSAWSYAIASSDLRSNYDQLMRFKSIFSASANDCSRRWITMPNRPYLPGAYPEPAATYFVYPFINDTSKNIALKFSGKFPHSRYMSLVVNNWNTGNYVAHLLDVDIEPQVVPDHPEQNSINPFRPGEPRDSDNNRNYDVWIVQEGSPRANEPNVMVVPAELKNVAVILRVYLPDADLPNDYMKKQGGVDLPSVTAYDETRGGETACPRILDSLDFMDSMDPPAPIPVIALNEEKIVFYRPLPIEGAGLYGNGLNPYLAAPLLRPPEDDSSSRFAVVRFRPPTFPRISTRDDMFTGAEDVRYWSICLGNLKNGATSMCFSDENTVVDEDGFVKLLIGPAGYWRGDHVIAGWNFMRWGFNARPVLLIRQIIPRSDFSGSFDRIEFSGREMSRDAICQKENSKLEDGTVVEDVEFYQSCLEEFKQNAQTYIDDNYNLIGDYSPQGIYCTQAQFETNQCGY